MDVTSLLCAALYSSVWVCGCLCVCVCVKILKIQACSCTFGCILIHLTISQAKYAFKR